MLSPSPGRHTIAVGAFVVAALLGCDSATEVRPATRAVLAAPPALASLSDGDGALFVGNLFAAGAPSNGILRYTAGGAFIDKFATGGCCMTFGPDDHLYIARQSAVHKVNGVTGAFLGVFLPANTVEIPFIPVLGPDGMMYVSTRGAAQSIRRYDRSGTADPDFFVDGTARGMSGGQYFAFGPDGNIYFTSGGTHEVLRFSVVDGSYMDTFVAAGAGGLVAPSGVTFDRNGIMYVGSPTTDRVLRFDRAGAYIGDFFPAGEGGLDSPVGITFGPDGDLYVASAATQTTAAVLRYDGSTGAFKGALVGPGDGVTTGPRTIEFKAKIAVCHAPPGHADRAFTLHIGYLSASEHVAHGDAVGACE